MSEVAVVRTARPWGEGILRSAGILPRTVPGFDGGVQQVQRATARRPRCETLRNELLARYQHLLGSHPATRWHRPSLHSSTPADSGCRRSSWPNSMPGPTCSKCPTVSSWASMICGKTWRLLDFDETCAEEFGKLRGWLRHQGVQRNAVRPDDCRRGPCSRSGAGDPQYPALPEHPRPAVGGLARTLNRPKRCPGSSARRHCPVDARCDVLERNRRSTFVLLLRRLQSRFHERQ